MKLDLITSPMGDMHKDAALLVSAEAAGFDGAWTVERGRNPFFALTRAGSASQRIRLGTLDALAFPRSPMVTAQLAWDLARQTEGRFCLGLRHDAGDARDFGEDWSDPSGRLREYIESLRAIWATFQHDARLRYRGDYYQFRLMAPFFNPGPIAQPRIPIFLQGASDESLELAAALGDGLFLPGYMNPSMLRETILPMVDTALRRHNRQREALEITAQVYVFSGLGAAEIQAAEIAARRLTAAWAEAYPDAYLIEDRTAQERVIVAAAQEVLDRVQERYGGLVDRVALRLHQTNDALIAAIGKSR